jgi:hypothetical protein
MGKLYDRRDLAWNTLFWAKQEQNWNGHLVDNSYSQNAQQLNMCLSYPAQPRVKGPDGQWLKDDIRPSRHITPKEFFRYEAQKERFKLLKTGRLLSNLRAWEAIFKACPKCYQETARVGDKTIDRPCADHEEGYKKAKSDVWWAGEHNEAERVARGQIRTDTDTTPEGHEQLAVEGSTNTLDTNPLNKWEARYQRDKAEDLWSARDAKRYEVQPDYKGWLRMLLEEEEMTEKEYLDELQRLRDEASELEFTTRAIAGTNTKVKRDSRHNQLGV